MREDDRLILEMALAIRDLRLYWARGRDALTLDDKREIARAIIDGLRRSHIELTVTRNAPPPPGRGTGEFMR